MASANAFPLFKPQVWAGVSGSSSATRLQQKINEQAILFEDQLPATKQFLQIQAVQLAEALLGENSRLSFQLPESVVCRHGKESRLECLLIPQTTQRQTVGGWFSAIRKVDLTEAFCEKLKRLEQGSDLAVSTAARLVRFSIAHTMVYDLLPAGNAVKYQSIEGEEIPSVPCKDSNQTQPVPEEISYPDRFFQPKWVSFDEKGHLLTGSILGAEERMRAMQRYLMTLQIAAVIDPYIVADCEYQRKRYGILGQMVSQGRALGRYWAFEIIAIIHSKLNAGKLNRGLSLSMPYFDERELGMKMYDFEVIPTGRVTFVPAFVVVSARNEQEKVFRNPNFSFGTRKYLLIQLNILEEAFQTFD